MNWKKKSQIHRMNLALAVCVKRWALYRYVWIYCRSKWIGVVVCSPCFNRISPLSVAYTWAHSYIPCIVIPIVDDSEEQKKNTLVYICNECFSLSRTNQSIYTNAEKEKNQRVQQFQINISGDTNQRNKKKK